MPSLGAGGASENAGADLSGFADAGRSGNAGEGLAGWVQAALGSGRVGLEELVGVAHVALGRVAEVASGAGALIAASDPGVLDALAGMLNVKNRVDAVVGELVGALDRSGAPDQLTGAGLTAFLTLKGLLTRQQASRIVLGARRAAGFSLVREAALSGGMNAAQAEAVTGVLRDLPRALDASQVGAAERYLVELAASTASDGLARAGERVLEEIAPLIAQQVGEDKARRQFERARRRRFFTVTTHADGVTTFTGSLPAVDGEILRQVVDAVAEKERRRQSETPGGKPLERRAARADALVAIAQHVQWCGQAPDLGASRARLILTVPLADLASPTGPTDGRLASTGDRVDAKTLKTLACDSDVMRAVLGAKGEVLDIGRATRVIPKALRLALTVRDSGCSFPGCDRPVEACHVHHIDPWWHGGPTSLSNTCLLCPSHHRLVEPPRDGPPDWVAQLRDDGLVEFTPPRWIDLDRKPILHHRFQARGAKPSSGPQPDNRGQQPGPRAPQDPPGDRSPF
ncbi:MAG: HNH endonuclease [Bifidobacteriaceae bacterium]|nr:HNH endonuclease [Bifidobacteriaceae bacterium]